MKWKNAREAFVWGKKSVIKAYKEDSYVSAELIVKKLLNAWRKSGLYNDKKAYDGARISFMSIKNSQGGKVIPQNIIENKKQSSTRKILIATTIWKRADIFKVFCKNNGRFADILAVGSEGDVSRNLAEQLGCFYLEHPNSPLGSKFNARLKWFLEREEYSHMILLGSDDLICENTFLKIDKLRSKYDVISWKDLYFFNMDDGHGIYSSGYKNHRKGEPFAPGRCISRKFVEKNKGVLWKNTTAVGCGLDKNIWERIMDTNNHIEICAADNDCMIVDIKTKENITKIKQLSLTLKNRPLTKEEILKIKALIC